MTAVVHADRTGRVLGRAHEDVARDLPVSAVVDGLHIHHGPQAHVWVVWHGRRCARADDTLLPRRAP